MLSELLLMAIAQLSTSTFDSQLHTKYLELPREQFIQYFNKQNYTWKIKHHSHLENIVLYCDTTDDDSFKNFEIRHHDPEIFSELPDNFDAREYWVNCPTIKEIYNQGSCGSCRAFATATVASDRTCVRKGSVVRLSEQDFSCLKPICLGGCANISFSFWRDKGLVTRECKPYNISEEAICIEECKDPIINYAKDKHFAEEIYAVSSVENDIRAELFTNGPVYVSFVVNADFADYSSGVYEHKYGRPLARHGVRLLGYGVENDVKYWLVANSWASLGQKWIF